MLPAADSIGNYNITIAINRPAAMFSEQFIRPSVWLWTRQYVLNFVLLVFMLFLHLNLNTDLDISTNFGILYGTFKIICAFQTLLIIIFGDILDILSQKCLNKLFET